MQQLLGAVAGNQEAMDDFVSVIAGTMSPVEFFDPDQHRPHRSAPPPGPVPRPEPPPAPGRAYAGATSSATAMAMVTASTDSRAPGTPASSRPTRPAARVRKGPMCTVWASTRRSTRMFSATW